jgi:LacI family transcriptional regulator
MVSELTTSQAAEAATLRLLGSVAAPTAIFSAQNLITIGVVHALRKLGRQHDVAVVGFDDVDLADLIDPGITVIAQQAAAIGRAAADRMFEQLDARGVHGRLAPIDSVLPVDLICRGSGEIRPPHAGRIGPTPS